MVSGSAKHGDALPVLHDDDGDGERQHEFGRRAERELRRVEHRRRQNPEGRVSGVPLSGSCDGDDADHHGGENRRDLGTEPGERDENGERDRHRNGEQGSVPQGVDKIEPEAQEHAGDHRHDDR